ncbi:nephrin-like isoform X2 [Aricia agestis]|uniref:nephrin-like isoform X2 n=1 Tax=Aricia agestis TaxID=91739 RepID=UPI001C204BA1|nr:nephrin-like isoform X2 [Aricia agestis]
MIISSLVVLTVLFKCCVADDTVMVDAVLGETAELPCNVTTDVEDDKLTVLAWYRNSSATAFYSHDLRGGHNVMSPSGRYNLVSSEDEGLETLQISNVAASDGGLYTCVAHFATSRSHKTFVQLMVIEPPQRLWVIYENGSRVVTASAGSNNSRNIGPYYIADTVNLFCVAFGGKPQSSLTWWTNQQLLKNATTPLSEQRIRSDLSYGPLTREDHGKVLTCFARNNERTPPLSIDVTIDMYLPPQLVSVRVTGPKGDSVSSGRVRMGEVLTLQCRVLGARPLPAVTWHMDDSQLTDLEQSNTMEPSQQLVVSEVRLAVTYEYDESQLTCCAPAQDRDVDKVHCAVSQPLTVLYPPVLKIVAAVAEQEIENATIAVVKGSTVVLNCSVQANPPVYQLIWFHKDDMVIQSADGVENSIQHSLKLTNVTEQETGDYVCAATNDEGSSYSEPVDLQVTYPPYCEDDTVLEYGVGENECVNLTCRVTGNPAPSLYHWMIVTQVDGAKLKNNQSVTLETMDSTLMYQRTNGSSALIYCWGLNGVVSEQPRRRCGFLVTDETAPRPPTDCVAIKNVDKEITVTCEEGHDGGMPQKFKFTVNSLDSEEPVMSIVSVEARFMIPEPKLDKYKFVISAFNDKGSSPSVEIDLDNIVDEALGQLDSTISAVTNITTLALALCGGVALLALAACGLVLCAHDRASDAPRPDPPLCAYTTDESNCDTCNDSDDASECNVRRTDSFRRAMAKYPSRNFDVRRTGSFHSTRYLHEDEPKCREIRHNTACRVHSLQNISRKRDMDTLCDHLVMHLPPDTGYSVPRPMNTFYTMPRKMRHKSKAEGISDEVSEITSDGFSLPPPPDEFNTYRAASKIRDVPAKATPTYTTIRKNITPKDPAKYTALASMTTVGLPTVPTISGAQNSLYSYPDDDKVTTNPFDEHQ